MTLKEANKELEKLDNEYTYWLNQKETLLNLVYPKATDIKPEIIQGGKREDRLLKYIELEDEKQINATLDYIHKRKNNLMNWMDTELKILLKYGEIESAIVQLKETRMLDTITKKWRERTWEEISQEVRYNKDHCRRIYRNYKNIRNI